MSKGKSKASKKKKKTASDRKQMFMKLVLSDTCGVCKTPCARGMQYWERMQQPGAVGQGIPCPLTKYYH